MIPLALLTVALVLHGSAEAMWALKGLIAGVAGVAVHDAVRIPMVVAGIWPDFIPRLGAWVVGSDEDQPFGGTWGATSVTAAASGWPSSSSAGRWRRSAPH
ncbi:hypothetical protein [Streptomyces caniscabiei]|uniref:Uncharacterized protein n=1 Tax=Streptomyces caniscabiei TaxID=2746961 RepID=A0A927L6I2_9ACTN|nr:hypothetical protein [Streptomyces caniscabiei]MBD9726332.1 hypothetical protein [Streptomyces caniscabiei]MDX3511815.1 hypothetical protein [Streptomyces caniscabiei]MDX3719364.1 hypothetical protein [Streptomyces caniscabiei]MDX3726180.1 hypothetical protein [Streptomyces caniscabiei]WEO29497.1 hypothetical protein IHE65_43530 [Streptomyces caniscabiei]